MTAHANSHRDFDAPKPYPYDASAATIAARGMQMLYQLLLPTDKAAAGKYLAAGNKLIEDTLRECGTPDAKLSDGKVDFGKDGWETLLQVRIRTAQLVRCADGTISIRRSMGTRRRRGG